MLLISRFNSTLLRQTKKFCDSRLLSTLIRNVAIVAHVDHGKTTLVNKLLQYTSPSSTLMDNIDLEQERGITIASKITRLECGSKVINVVDTPGHVDFSGEVDRMLSIVDGVCLVIDPKEGIKSQTRYVLERAIEDKSKKVILVLNKCDVPEGWDQVQSGLRETEVFDLLDNLGATEEQMDFETVYASGKNGWCTMDIDVCEKVVKGEIPIDHDDVSMQVLIDAIVRLIPGPVDMEDERLGIAVATVGKDLFLGNMCTGRIYSGSVSKGDNLLVLPRDGDTKQQKNSKGNNMTGTVTGMFVHKGVERCDYSLPKAIAGDIVTLSGVSDVVSVGDTITQVQHPLTTPIATPPLPPPILSMLITINNSPLMGQDGDKITFNSIWDRLEREVQNNVSIHIAKHAEDEEKAILNCRGTLQLGILLEMLRRENYEITVSPPIVITMERNGTLYEPFEELVVEVGDEYANVIMNTLTSKEGLLVDMTNVKDLTISKFEIPTRRLLGLNLELATKTRGTAVLHHRFLEERIANKLKIKESKVKSGKLVSNASGEATLFALGSIANRGNLFIAPGDKVYPGMIIGERTDQNKHQDLDVNPVKAKKLDNMRTQSKETKVRLEPPRTMAVEEILGYMDIDEVVEVTPKAIRLRKKELDSGVRARIARSSKKIPKK